MIRFHEVTKRFDDGTAALDGITLEIAPGEVFGIVGASGAGKSTMLRCINALEQPSSGDVSIEGCALRTLDDRALGALRKRIGMIFQGFHLFERKTIRQNVAFPLELLKLDKQKIRNKVDELLDCVGIAEKADAYPAQLSGGQKQRAAIARAIATDPAILLCDEATSALDPQTTAQILDLLRRINRDRGITIVLITHEMSVVKRIADRVAILDAGRIQRVERTADLFASAYETMWEDGALRIPDIETKGHCFALRFPEHRTSTSPIITTAARTLDLDINILTASLESIQDRIVGQLLIELDRDTPPDKLARFLRYLEEQQVRVEEVRRG